MSKMTWAVIHYKNKKDAGKILFKSIRVAESQDFFENLDSKTKSKSMLSYIYDNINVNDNIKLIATK